MKILVAGDFAPMNRVADAIEAGRFVDVFGQLKEYTNTADYSIINLEAPIVVDNDVKPAHKTGPNIKSTPRAIEAINYAGFNCVSLANNHFYDYGEDGVKDTIESCQKHKIDYVGGGQNLKDASKILYKKINNQTLAIINVCENEWSIATETHGGSAPLDIIGNYNVIVEAKQNADFVIVIIHGGTEHYQYPTPRMQKTYRFFIDVGADVVVNHHQHCYSGYETYNEKTIFYGLGNLCFDKRINKLWNEGYILILDLGAKINFTIHPYSQCAKDSVVDFKIIDKESFFNEMKQINDIIANSILLQQKFEMMASQKMNLLNYFEPCSHRYFSALRHYKLLPSFTTKNKLMLWHELFRCESHKDVMFHLLKTRYKNN